MRLGGYFFRVTIKSIADIAQFKTALMQLIKEINSKDIDNTSSVNKFNKGYVSSTSFPTFAVSVGGVTPISINDSSYNTIPLACLHYNTYLAKCQYIYLKMYKVTSYICN